MPSRTLRSMNSRTPLLRRSVPRRTSCAPVPSSTMSTNSTRRSSACMPARRGWLIRSSGSCSNAPGRRSRMPATTQPVTMEPLACSPAAHRTAISSTTLPVIGTDCAASPVTYQVSDYPVLLGAGLDFVATRIAYKLDVRGPCLSLQTACSTSLVAIVQACQSLLCYACDMALAGGVSITLPQKRGYHYQEGGMVLAGRDLPHLRCRGERNGVRQRRRHRAAQAPVGCAGRRRPHLCVDQGVRPSTTTAPRRSASPRRA